jgi:AcrR family transcriptional regulator
LALSELLKTKDFGDVTVSEVCRQGGLARKTFYRDFSSLEDVLDFAVSSSVKDFAADPSDKTLGDFLERLISFAYVNKARLLDLEKQGLLSRIAASFKKCLLANDSFRGLLVGEGIIPAERSEYDLAFLLGAETGLLERWVKNGCQETPDQLVAISFETIDHFETNK